MIKNNVDIIYFVAAKGKMKDESSMLSFIMKDGFYLQKECWAGSEKL